MAVDARGRIIATFPTARLLRLLKWLAAPSFRCAQAGPKHLPAAEARLGNDEENGKAPEGRRTVALIAPR
jgi:hypothetical protein